MKLPDFFKFEPLIRLKRQMEIPDDVYGSLSVDGEPGRLTVEELDRLTSGEGIDVSFDELTILKDGTLAYKDSRVLLYIRDVHVYGDSEREPRYHLSNCATLQEMNEKGRFDRYVIATEDGGVFKINLISSGKTKTERRRLSVCQNCLHGLAFEGFSSQMDRRTRARIVSEFSPDQFFAVYPRSLHVKRPTYDSDTAPLNDYPSDFHEISDRVRRESGWQCDACKRVLSDNKLRRYLDVHHINGDRRDNRNTNLRALCVGCHANQPNHHHVKNDPRYRAYILTLTGPN